MGGIGFYLYGKKIGLSKEGATLASVIFSFSSAYGGCFFEYRRVKGYGLVALVAYLAREAGRKKKFGAKLLWLLVLGVALSQILTAGSLQLALYALIFMGLIICLKENRLKVILYSAGHFLSA